MGWYQYTVFYRMTPFYIVIRVNIKCTEFTQDKQEKEFRRSKLSVVTKLPTLRDFSYVVDSKFGTPPTEATDTRLWGHTHIHRTASY